MHHTSPVTPTHLNRRGPSRAIAIDMIPSPTILTAAVYERPPKLQPLPRLPAARLLRLPPTWLPWSSRRRRSRFDDFAARVSLRKPRARCLHGPSTTASL